MKRNTILSLALVFCLAAAATVLGITISWDPNALDEEVSAYHIYKADTPQGPYSHIGTVNITTNQTNTSFSIPLPPGRYYFYVTASNLWTESAPSNTAISPAPANKVLGPKITK